MDFTAPLHPIPLDAIRDAGRRIAGVAVRTPLTRLEWPEQPGEIHLKLENLQPIGSFKLRGAANAMLRAGRDALADGVYTASAGNMAQGVAWCARLLGVPCRVIVPEHAPAIKIAAIERLGGAVIKVPFDVWWQTMLDGRYPGLDELFIHPFADNAVMAGNGTIGVEVLEDLDGADAVFIPWGGGGLCCGIASAVRALSPATRIYAVEAETAAPLTASRAAGHAVTIVPTPSFVDGMGGRGVSPAMWPLAAALVDGVVIVSLAQIAAAIRLLVDRCRVVAEGAGAAPVAAAISGAVGAKRAVCIVSGGNIDPSRLATILRGDIP